MSGDADTKIREGFLDPAVVPEGGACPSSEVLWHAARGDLRADAMGQLIDHLALCGACTEDFRLVRQVAQQPPPQAAAPGLLARLAAAIVAPAPALAYLVLVCVCLALLARRPAEVAAPSSPAPQRVALPPEIASVLPEVRLTGDAATRGEGQAPEPVAVPSDRVLLRLWLDEPPADPGALDRLRVRVSAAEVVLWEEELPLEALAPDGSLPLVLDLSSREAGEIVQVTVEHVVPDGRVERLFGQTLQARD